MTLTQARRYSVICTTPSHPNGVRYPCRDHPLYTRDEAIAVMRKFAKQGHKSDWDNLPFGVYAEGPGERILLCDIDPKTNERTDGFVPDTIPD